MCSAANVRLSACATRAPRLRGRHPPRPAPPLEEPTTTTTTEPFQPLDPSADYSGKVCSFFTKPLRRPDGGGTNSYADDTWISYGGRTYHCENRYWVRREADGPVKRREC